MYQLSTYIGTLLYVIVQCKATNACMSMHVLADAAWPQVNSVCGIDPKPIICVGSLANHEAVVQS